jgi:prepilin-type N-terminal cleavage/methylation domain-containing protein
MSPGEGRPGRRGFTLIELVVALLLFEVVLFGAVASVHLAATMARRARVTEVALWEAGALADSIRVGRSDGAGRRARPWGWIERAGDRVEAHDSTGRRLVVLEVLE